MSETINLKVAEVVATPESFEKWLDGKDTEAVVGKPYDCAHCPISRFLGSQFPGYIFWVHHGFISVRNKYNQLHEVTMPIWAGKFICALHKEQITVSEAKRVLRYIEQYRV